ncbi:hypothetical protein ANO11243_074860 [Dothideomycetidae sp. 11243]|nr:hypothetical protein ANO11243_074860 [fungal sp. No.11243]
MSLRAFTSGATRLAARSCSRSLYTAARYRPQALRMRTLSPTSPSLLRPSRFYSDKTLADEKIEEITELYATAKDEVGSLHIPSSCHALTLSRQFEIAMEETEKATVYAEDDRAAALEELGKVQQAYKDIIEGRDKELADEVKRRIGQRIRELEHGVKAMQELAQNHD